MSVNLFRHSFKKIVKIKDIFHSHSFFYKLIKGVPYYGLVIDHLGSSN